MRGVPTLHLTSCPASAGCLCSVWLAMGTAGCSFTPYRCLRTFSICLKMSVLFKNLEPHLELTHLIPCASLLGGPCLREVWRPGHFPARCIHARATRIPVAGRAGRGLSSPGPVLSFVLRQRWARSPWEYGCFCWDPSFSKGSWSWVVFNVLMHTAVWWLQQDSLASPCLAAAGVIGLSVGQEGTPRASHLFTCFSGWHWIFKAQWLL